MPKNHIQSSTSSNVLFVYMQHTFSVFLLRIERLCVSSFHSRPIPVYNYTHTHKHLEEREKEAAILSTAPAPVPLRR